MMGDVSLKKEFTDDCIFNEQMEQHHYNTYSSTQHSNARRTLYLALNKTGQPRKIQIPVNRTLGKLATYTKALTLTVAHDRVEQLISRLFGADHVRHGLNHLCETGQPLVELTAKEMRSRPVCGAQAGPVKGMAATTSTGVGGGGGGKKNGQQNTAGKDEKEGLRQKKKKKRRKCREDEVPGEHCFRPGAPGAGLPGGPRNGTQPPSGGNTGPTGGGPSRKPKKPNQQSQNQQQQMANGKRNGTGGNSAKPNPAKIKLVGASIVTSKLSHPKPASLMIARTVRPTTPFPLVTARPTTGPTTVSNDLLDTSQQSDDSELGYGRRVTSVRRARG
uniref:Fibroblast growth factor n=1 Tax=Anopheles melas TaxID=34690 RepID=A0A182UCM5_9DIPT